MTINNKGATILQTAIVKVSIVGNITKQIKCRVLMDSGSHRSYVTLKVAEELKLPILEESNLTIFTFGTETPQEIRSPVVTLQMQSQTGETVVIHANCVEFISRGGIPYIKLEEVNTSYLLADDGSLKDQVHILIGNDYYFNIVREEKIQLSDNLFLVNSALGWFVSGQIEPTNISELSVITYTQSSSEMGLKHPDLPLCNGDIKKLWELESIGINDSPNSNREEEAVKYFNETTQKINNRYTVSWPWIKYPPDLSDNYGMAFGRLTNLLKRMDTDTFTEYDKILKDQMDRGIIEVVPDSAHSMTNKVIHYLPHHAIKHPGKTMRIVYDASSKIKDSKSLNECLYRGPMMLENLTGLLLKFRSHRVGLSSDIEKAFLQMALHERDRDVTRFLWIKNKSKPVSKDNLMYLRFCRVPFGVISSPYLLNATIKHHLSNSDIKEVREKANDIYVDNFISGSDSTAGAMTLYENLKGTFQEISMNLRDWSSNSKEFVQRVPDACTDERVNVLGLEWNTNKDTLRLKFTNPRIEACTKREVLKIIASVYDPCGYAVPHILRAKLFLQHLWKEKLKWDSPLPKELRDEWLVIHEGLNAIKNVSINRCYMKNTKAKNYELHCFTDASLQAYSASVFLVNGSEKSFVIGKSRLTPTKDQENLKIPRLELLGVLIGCRLMKFVLQFLQLNITRQILWTDSQIVIEWSKSDKLLPPFVARRIEEIKRNQELEIRYVPSELNAADVGTRPISSKEDKEKWLTGPQFLVESQVRWPNGSNTVNTHSFSAGEGPTKEKKTIDDPMEIDNPDTHNSDSIIKKMDTQVNEKEKQDDVNIEEDISNLKRIQSESFPLETEGKITSLSRNLGLFKDIDGLLRCKGRMKYADWSFDKRYPILIPKNTDFTENIITKFHRNNKHVGVSHTLDRIRQLYWIPQGRSQVQRILRKCPECVKYTGGPYKLPLTPALPKERVNYSSPFTCVGMDYMGPLIVNNGNGNCKRWICLYTCLAVRAIHLEVVNDLTAEEGLLALRRMISTRGVPDLITSDNATHFKLISEILQDKYCVEKKILWKFIPQLAPWHGGFYERLVGLVKNCMKRTLHKHLLRDNQLITVVKEIEAVLNTRPLTRVDSEPEHVLKPSDFLTMGKCIEMKTSDMDLTITPGTVTKDNLVRSWKRAIVILNEFKDMFSNRYLLSLRERYSHGPKEQRVTSRLTPMLGQIVQIKGDSKNRVGWKVGKIVSLIKGVDGMCRVAKVKVGDTIFTRSIAHLYPLEIEDKEEDCAQSSETKNSEDGEDLQLPEFPVQSAKDDVPVTLGTPINGATGPPVEKESIRVLDKDETADKRSPFVDQSKERDSDESVEPTANILPKPISDEHAESELLEQSHESKPRRVAAIGSRESFQGLALKRFASGQATLSHYFRLLWGVSRRSRNPKISTLATLRGGMLSNLW